MQPEAPKQPPPESPFKIVLVVCCTAVAMLAIALAYHVKAEGGPGRPFKIDLVPPGTKSPANRPLAPDPGLGRPQLRPPPAAVDDQ